MLDKKTFKRELVRMWDSIRHDGYEGGNDCFGVECGKCPLDLFCNSTAGENIYNLFEINETVEKWSKEHQKQKYKVSQLECDILEAFIDYGFVYYFYDSDLLMSLLRSGYFQGATSEMDIRNYFNDCEVVADDD